MPEFSPYFWENGEWECPLFVLVCVIKVQPRCFVNHEKKMFWYAFWLIIFCYSPENTFVDLRLCLPPRNSPIILPLTCSTTQRQAFLKAITRLYYLSRRALSAFRSVADLFTGLGITFTAWINKEHSCLSKTGTFKAGTNEPVL